MKKIAYFGCPMRIIRTVFVLAGLFLLLALQSGCKRKNYIEEGLPWVPKNLGEATALINDKCPEWVDSESRLDSVLLLPEGLTFYYSLPNKVKSTFDVNAFKAFLLPEIIDNIQTNYRLQMHRDSSITMIFNYLDRGGELVTEFSVKPEIYK